MARFRGALVLLCAYSFLISGSLSTTVSLVNWNSPICFNGTIPDTTSCTNYYTCTNPLMTWLQAFFQWTKNTWWNSFNYTTGTCSLHTGSWETSFFLSNSQNLNSVLPNLGSMIGKMRIRRKRQVPVTVQGVLAPLLSSLLSSGKMTQKSAVSLTCSGRCTGNEACFFDDLHHDCRIWDLLNAARQTACGPTTTTTAAPTTAVPTTAAPTTQPKTAAASGTTTIAAGDSCPAANAGNDYVCSGGDTVVQCDGSTYVVVSSCSSTQACYIGANGATCGG